MDKGPENRIILFISAVMLIMHCSIKILFYDNYGKGGFSAKLLACKSGLADLDQVRDSKNGRSA